MGAALTRRAFYAVANPTLPIYSSDELIWLWAERHLRTRTSVNLAQLPSQWAWDHDGTPSAWSSFIEMPVKERRPWCYVRWQTAERYVPSRSWTIDATSSMVRSNYYRWVSFISSLARNRSSADVNQGLGTQIHLMPKLEERYWLNPLLLTLNCRHRRKPSLMLSLLQQSRLSRLCQRVRRQKSHFSGLNLVIIMKYRRRFFLAQVRILC